MANDLSIKLSLIPGLDVNALNAVLSTIKEGLGELGNNIKMIDPEAFKSAMDSATESAKPKPVPAPPMEKPKVPEPDTSAVGPAGEKASKSFVGRFKEGLGNLKTNLNTAFGEMGAALKSGSLSGAVDGIGGSLLNLAGKAGPWGAAIAGGVAAVSGAFTSLYNKGKEIDDIRDGFELMFAGKGMQGDQITAAVDQVMSSVSKMSYNLDVPKDKLRELFAVSISAGKSGDAAEGFLKQGLAVEKMTNGVVSANEVMKLLNKGMANPENQAVFNKLAAKAPELAAGLKAAGNEQERLAFLSTKTGAVLDKMAEQAKSPETAIDRLGKVWSAMTSTAATETFNLGNMLLAPIGDFADWVMENMKTIKSVIKTAFEYIAFVWEMFVVTPIKTSWTIISTLGSIIVDVLVGAWNLVSKAVSGVVSWLGNLFGMSGKGNSFFGSLVNSIQKAGSVMNHFRGIVAGVSGAFSAFMDLIKETWDRLKSFDISGAFSVWSNAGSRIAEGFTKSYNEKVNSLKEEQTKKELKEEEKKEEKKNKVKSDKGKDAKDNEKKLSEELLKMQNDLEERKFQLASKGIQDKTQKELSDLEYKNKKELNTIAEQTKKIEDAKKAKGVSAKELAILDQELAVQNEMKKVAEQVFQADKKAILDKAAQEEHDKKVEMEKQTYDFKIKLIEDETKKREDALKQQLESQKAFNSAFLKAFEDTLKQRSDAQKNADLAALDSKFGKTKEVDPKEEAYNRQKEQIEQKAQRRLLAIQAASQVTAQEQQRQSDLKALELQRQSAQAKLDEAVKSGNMDEIGNQMKAMDEVNAKVAEKGDVLMQYSGQLSESMGEIFGNLFTGNEEGLKASATKIFSSLAAILKKQLAATVASQLMQTLSVSGPYAWLASAAIGAVIYAGLSAIIDPIVNSLTSFSTGGRVDSPTLALIGDASRSRAGADTEWVFRDDQIQALLRKAVFDAMATFQANTVVPAYMLPALAPLMSGINALSSSINTIASASAQLATLNVTMDKFNESVSFFEQYSVEDVLNGAEIRSFMAETLAHQGRLESKLDQILNAINNGQVIVMDGQKVAESVNRQNIAVASRQRTVFN